MVDTKPVGSFVAKCVKGPYELIRHMRYALSKGYPTVRKIDEHGEEIVLVGAGPSLVDTVEEVRRLKNEGKLVVAIKSAHDFLIDRGIIPDVALAVDPQEKIANLYRKPHEDVSYFIATQCHPEVFDALHNNKLVTWNLFTKSVFSYWKGHFDRKKQDSSLFFVNGGSTSGLRAIGLSWVIGYRKCHLFGFDSCLKPPEGEVTEESLKQSDLKINGVKIEKDVMVVDADGKRFYCDGAMALQANEFLHQLEKMKEIRVKAYGEGLIPWIVERAALRGMEQCRLVDEDFIQDSPLRGSLTPVQQAA